jgi:hypothetical protein
MLKKISVLLFLYLISQSSDAQTARIVINGKIKNSVAKPISNTHIINLTTKVGTVSNEDGAFQIPVKEGDWLQISNIQFITKKVKIKKGNLKEQSLLIHLIPVENKLEEVVIKKKLKGFLSLDRIDKKKDTIPKVNKEYYNFSTMDLSFKGIKNLQDKSNAQYQTDPTMKNVATTIASVGISDNSSKKKRARRNLLNFKKNLPSLIIKEYGNKFFIETLKIPKNHLFLFLEYCNQFNIDQLFKERKHLKLLKILLKESKSYLLLLENNK